jgi:hypothetical protein
MNSVRYHLGEALRHAHLAASFADLALEVPEYRVEPMLVLAAMQDGKAAGHAFRAAELAYDLGAGEARFKCDECGEYDGSHEHWCGT